MSSRRFGMVKPETLWKGTLAKELRKHAAEVRELVAYLLTGPTSDTWGIWHLEMDTMVLQTGRKEANIAKALALLEELRFCFYDLDTQFVFVPDMPASQFVRWPLLPNDNNVRHAKRWYASLPTNPFLERWYDHHLADLHLDGEPEPVERRAFGGASKGLSVGSKEIAMDLLGEKEIQPAHARVKATGMSAKELDEFFEQVCAIYPKQAKLSKARTALTRIRPTHELLEQIWAALQWQVKQRDWLKEGGHFAPSLYNYFQDKRWLDRKPTVQHMNQGTAAVVSGMADFVNDRDICETPRRNVPALPPRSAK